VLRTAGECGRKRQVRMRGYPKNGAALGVEFEGDMLPGFKSEYSHPMFPRT
jgi:hypothetical protein